MPRKIIEDYSTLYLNDLFEIKLIFFTIRVVCCTVSICMDAIFFDMRCSFQFSPYICNR